MALILVALTLVAPFGLGQPAAAARYTPQEKSACRVIGERKLVEQLIQEDVRDRQGHLTADQIGIFSATREARGKLFVKTEARVRIPPPYKGVRVEIYEYEMQPPACRILGEELIEDEIYD